MVRLGRCWKTHLFSWIIAHEFSNPSLEDIKKPVHLWQLEAASYHTGTKLIKESKEAVRQVSKHQHGIHLHLHLHLKLVLMFQTYFWFWSKKQKKETSKVQVQMQIKATCWHAGLFITLLNAKQLVDRCLASLIFHPPGSDKFPECQERFIEREREGVGGCGWGKRVCK